MSREERKQIRRESLFAGELSEGGHHYKREVYDTEGPGKEWVSHAHAHAADEALGSKQ